jgi:hypothetical protein
MVVGANAHLSPNREYNLAISFWDDLLHTCGTGGQAEGNDSPTPLQNVVQLLTPCKPLTASYREGSSSVIFVTRILSDSHAVAMAASRHY